MAKVILAESMKFATRERHGLWQTKFLRFDTSGRRRHILTPNLTRKIFGSQEPSFHRP